MRRGASICYAEERFAPQIELYSWRPPAIPGSFSKGTQVKNIFVGNLDFATNESDLRALFEPYGAIERVSVVTDRDTGRSRGFAFVEMASNSEASSAISALDGREVNGRAIKVNEARPKSEGGGGGYGGNRSGGGGGPRKRREPRW
jgi:RNA recognition motif-containing protein